MKRVKHPSGLEILFDPKWHQFKIGHTTLRAVSKLLDRYFPFDEAQVLHHLTRKTGMSVEAIKKNWSRQALLGKNLHEYIECRLLDLPPPAFVRLLPDLLDNNNNSSNNPSNNNFHTVDTNNQNKNNTNSFSESAGSRSAQASSREAKDLSKHASSQGDAVDELEGKGATVGIHGEEGLYLAAVDAAVDAVRRDYDILAVEQIIASPEWGLAGVIDLLARHKTSHRVLLADWKTTSAVSSSFRFGSFETPSGGCLRHLPNGKVYRYAIQLAMYGEILKQQRYFESGYFDAALERCLGKDILNNKNSKLNNNKNNNGKAKTPTTPTAQISVDAAFYKEGGLEGKLDYGLVQFAKTDEGEVVAEFKAVRPETVLPPDEADTDFKQLMQKVMQGL